ncbi:hypothetical protein EMEDMD4_210014 [Sinorhizobium medicae]|uniref:Uncharacterized protein n=1 Tax=Sinorhizobium medicae TaxID=110321 RepID=A0A508WYR5_9HYPH|nr:hypothetical protein EMEDMD4_210014 [Sinorhizobium medicae]
MLEPLRRGSGAASISLKLVACEEPPVGARVEIRMAVFEARDFGKFEGLAYGHDADFLAAALALHTDFHDTIEMTLSHDSSPVLFFMSLYPGTLKHSKLVFVRQSGM